MTPAFGAMEEIELVARARDGDREAFAELYDRYFGRVYDFLRRTLGSEADAADTTQEVFIKAMSAIATLADPGAFRAWIFTSARNLALSRVRSRRPTLSLDFQEDDSQDAALATLIPDPDIEGSPESALEQSETSRLVWAVAAGLDARQYAVLDLTVRQGLDASEMAEVLGVTRNNAYVLVNRTKAAFAESATDYLDFIKGRRDCSRLNADLDEAGIDSYSAKARRVIDRHVRHCARCGERRKAAPVPLSVFGALAAAVPPAGLHGRIREQLLHGPTTPDHADDEPGANRRRRSRGTMLAGAATVLIILLGAGVFWATGSEDHNEASGNPLPATSAGQDTGTGKSPTSEGAAPAPITGTKAPAGSPGGSPSPETGSTPTPDPGTGPILPAVAPSPSTSPSPTAAGSPTVPATSTPTPVPTATSIPTATATRTATPSPIPTPVPTPFPTPVPTPTQTPQALTVSNISTCWDQNQALHVSFVVNGAGAEPVTGDAVVQGNTESASFVGGTGSVLFSPMPPGAYPLVVHAFTATRFAQVAGSTSAALCP